MTSDWLADGIEPFPPYSPELGEPVGVIVWRPKAVDPAELADIMHTTAVWLDLCGYTLCGLPGRWVRRRKAQSFDDWWQEVVQAWAEEKRTEGGS